VACMLNGGSRRCEFIRPNGEQCRLSNSLFRVRVQDYKQTLVMLGVDTENLDKIKEDTTTVLCWRHAEKTIKMRVKPMNVPWGKNVYGLYTETARNTGDFLALFGTASPVLTERAYDEKCGGDAYVCPYGLPPLPPSPNDTKRRFRENSFERGVADYANDARKDVTYHECMADISVDEIDALQRDRMAALIARLGGPELPNTRLGEQRAREWLKNMHYMSSNDEGCWKLTDEETKLVNAEIVSVPATGKHYLRAISPIVKGGEILLDYGAEYWSGYYTKLDDEKRSIDTVNKVSMKRAVSPRRRLAPIRPPRRRGSSRTKPVRQ
jgi:hypothetical protein